MRCGDVAATRAPFESYLTAFVEDLNAKTKWRVEGSGRTLILSHDRQRVALGAGFFDASKRSVT